MRPTLKALRVFPTVLGALLLAVSASAAEPTPKRALLIVSKTSHALAIVDPASLKVLGRVPVGEDPHEVVASPDGKTAYVSNTGFGRFHELNVIDLVAQKALPNVDTAPLMGPHGLAYVGGKVWFTAQGSKAVGRAVWPGRSGAELSEPSLCGIPARQRLRETSRRMGLELRLLRRSVR